ncbi:MAG: hypothetical protein MUD08_10445 [Cytophagales bacterium]|jgi:hypothetical protein|nr:hypothetical protein [Cytophagales bacterium]
MNLATDSVKRKILRDFIDESVSNKDFKDDKGIVRLIVYKDKNGLLHWKLSTTINDGFLNVNPPTKYFDFMGDLVLIWEADANGKTLQTTGDTAAIKQCLRKKITDRLYIQPPSQHRWTALKSPVDAKRNLEGIRRRSLGGGYIIVFNKDGSYTKTPLA